MGYPPRPVQPKDCWCGKALTDKQIRLGCNQCCRAHGVVTMKQTSTWYLAHRGVMRSAVALAASNRPLTIGRG